MNFDYTGEHKTCSGPRPTRVDHRFRSRLHHIERSVALLAA